MRKGIALLLAAVLGMALAAPIASAAGQTEIKLMTWHGPETVTQFYAGYEEIAM